MTLSLSRSFELLATVCGCGTLAAQAPVPVPLNYNFNGIVHSGEAGVPDDPNGFRSISDRALDFSAGIPSDPLLADFQLVSSAGALDIVHLGNRNTVDNGGRAFDTTADGDQFGTRPAWLPNADQSGPQVSTLAAPIAVQPGTVADFLFQISNGGGTFDVTLSFASGASLTATLEGPDWFAGSFAATDTTDLALPGPGLRIDRGRIDLGAFVGDAISAITFDNPSNPIGGYAILAASLTRPARAVPGRRACVRQPFGFTLIPTTPGYVLIPTASFDAAFASGTVVSSADDAVVGGLALSFPFVMPGGSTVQQVAVDTNGRVLEDVGAPSEFSPSVADLLGGAPSICPLWADWNPGSPNSGGSLWFHDDGTGSSASVTWDRIVQFDGLETNRSTFQTRLNADGSIEFRYEDLQINEDVGASPDDVLIGVSAGNGAADPDGESSLSTTATITSTDDVLYEFFDFPAEPFGLSRLPNDTVRLAVASPPALGSDFSALVIDQAGTATATFFLFGFPTGIFVPSLPLGGLIPGLADCELLNDIVTPNALFSTTAATPGTPTTIFSVPNLPALVGLGGFGLSALVVDPTLSPAIFPTDERIVTIGL